MKDGDDSGLQGKPKTIDGAQSNLCGLLGKHIANVCTGAADQLEDKQVLTPAG